MANQGHNWRIRLAASMLTGCALWAWLAWRQVPQALTTSAILTAINFALYWIIPDKAVPKHTSRDESPD